MADSTSPKPNRAPSTSWLLRRAVQNYPNGYVNTIEGDEVQVVYFMHEGYPQAMILSRKDARLLAKRINQCLDSTAVR